MSGDELFVTLAAVALGPVAWLVWLFRMAALQRMPGRASATEALAAALAACAGLIFLVLDSLASFDVVDDVRYQFMYLVLGMAWLFVAQFLFPFAGLSARDDAVERGNAAATIALAGALLGVALCYAGGNIGDGPGWWVVVFSAALSTGTLIVLWLLLTALTPVADAVVIDRDPAAGVRLGAFLVAVGLVLGRGVAGDWESAPQTVADFTPALAPAAAIVAVAILVERLGQPTPERPRLPVIAFGLMPAIAYLALAVVGVRFLGWPV